MLMDVVVQSKNKSPASLMFMFSSAVAAKIAELGPFSHDIQV